MRLVQPLTTFLFLGVVTAAVIREVTTPGATNYSHTRTSGMHSHSGFPTGNATHSITGSSPIPSHSTASWGNPSSIHSEPSISGRGLAPPASSGSPGVEDAPLQSASHTHPGSPDTTRTAQPTGGSRVHSSSFSHSVTRSSHSHSVSGETWPTSIKSHPSDIPSVSGETWSASDKSHPSGTPTVSGETRPTSIKSHPSGIPSVSGETWSASDKSHPSGTPTVSGETGPTSVKSHPSGIPSDLSGATKPTMTTA